MPAICRKGDSLTTGHVCTSVTTLDTPTQSTVRANGILIARVGDPTVSHPHPPAPPCPPSRGKCQCRFINCKSYWRICGKNW
jgi:hypothetical protein